MEYLGDLQICPILSFKTGSFTKQFITVLHSKSCWAESEPESFCPLSSCSALRGLCHCLSSKRGSLDNTYFLTFGLASHSSGAVSRIFCLFAIPSAYLNHIWQLFHLVAFEEQLHQSSFALWWPLVHASLCEKLMHGVWLYCHSNTKYLFFSYTIWIGLCSFSRKSNVSYRPIYKISFQSFLVSRVSARVVMFPNLSFT